MKVEQFPDRIIKVNGMYKRYFGGTSYLGMASNKEFQNMLLKNIAKWGSSYGSSRNANVQLSVYDRAEKLLAKWVESEAALTLTSGTLAGKLVVEYLSKSDYKFYHFSKTHPAILAQSSLPLFINGKLQDALLNHVPENIVIAADAILSLEVVPTRFDVLKEISTKKKLTLLIDESHSLGVVGNNGNGIFSRINELKLDRKIMISSLGKALGLSAGIVAADMQCIEDLKKEATFVSSSGASPAFLETFVEAQELYFRQQQKLKANLVFVFSKLKMNSSLIFDKNYPVIYSNNDRIFTTLEKHGIVITRFQYPTYEKPMNRMVITANHSKEDLEKLISVLNNYDK